MSTTYTSDNCNDYSPKYPTETLTKYYQLFMQEELCIKKEKKISKILIGINIRWLNTAK